MREELMQLAAGLNRPASEEPSLPDVDLAAAAAKITVVLPAGGFGYRMRAIGQDTGAGAQKSLLPLPNGEAMIDRVIRQYAEAGFKKFVALVNFEGHTVEQHLAGGERWGVEVRCSYDPIATGSGKTGAILNAIENGILAADGTIVIQNPDCQIVNYGGNFAADLVQAHLAAVRDLNAIATLVAVDGLMHPYTGMSLDGMRVREIAMYPFIPFPGHAGITVLTSEGLGVMRERGGQGHFERDMFPLWAGEGRLGAMLISHETWFAVDDRKAYREVTKAIETELVETPRD